MPNCLLEAFGPGTLNTFLDFLQTKAGAESLAGPWEASQGGKVGLNKGIFPPEYALQTSIDCFAPAVVRKTPVSA